MVGWIGVDLDGTLAYYEGWQGADHIGQPIPEMVARVRRWLDSGHDVRIFTARVSDGQEATRERIELWSLRHIGQRLKTTCVKDYGMVELWDDRAVQVVANTGRPVGTSTRGL